MVILPLHGDARRATLRQALEALLQPKANFLEVTTLLMRRLFRRAVA